MNILYKIENSLYVNITNKCPCNCIFCIRTEKDGINEGESLWLEYEPTLDEILKELAKYDLSNFEEVVFCGYGEPLMRINEVVSISSFIKSKADVPIRINTNGLGNRIHGRDIIEDLKGKIDTISISLNAPTKEGYYKITRPIFGIDSFDEVLTFAKLAKEKIPKVIFSVVDILDTTEILACKQLASNLSIPLKIRPKQ